MKPNNSNVLRKRQEAGVALLIAIFILLLISGVAVALIVASGTESSLAGNYRSSTSVYYAGLAGLEEGRGRLLPMNPDYFDNTVSGFIPTAGPLALGQVRYILNPLPGETVAPTNLSSTTTYPDNEYQTEFGTPVTSATVQTIPSVSTVAGIQGPLYKWVRITAATEKSLNIDVNDDGVLDSTTPLYYDPAHVNSSGNPDPSLIVSATPPATASQVMEVTALAALPNGSQRMLQYDVSMNSLGLTFPSALTMDGPGSTYSPANSGIFQMVGDDGDGITNNANQPPGPCPGSQQPRPAIGTVSNANASSIITSVSGPPNRSANYWGIHDSPSIFNVSSSLPPNYTTPSGLSGPGPTSVASTIYANATQVLSCPTYPLAPFCSFTDANLNLGSATAPQITFVEGNLSLGPVTGYGILVVTGNLTMSGNSGWRGAVLVIGQGTMTVNGGGNNEIDGALFLANTLNASGNLLNTLGPTTLNWNGGGGNGVNYSSCWISDAQNSTKKFNLLSFREIPY